MIHGKLVVSVAAVSTQPPASHSPLFGDVPRFTGRSTACIWGILQDDPDPHLDSAGKDRTWDNRLSYMRSVAGNAMMPLIDLSLAELGVDL